MIRKLPLLLACLWAALSLTLMAGPVLAQDKGIEDAWQERTTGMDFMRVPGGCFKMGCEGEGCTADQRPAREVCLDPFYVGRHEVTQAQWTRVMGQNPSEFKLGDNYPVERVSWNEAQNFLRKLSEQSPGPFRFRLPTEAEWEYLCQRCAPSKDSGKAPAKGNPKGRATPRPVGADEGACQGVQDLSGNVAQWTADVYNKEAYTHLGKSNPLNTSGGFDRVYRGACWVGSPDRISCQTRFHATPNTADPCLGLRLVMVSDKSRKEDKPQAQAKPQPDPAAEARASAPGGPNTLRKVLLKSDKNELSVEFVTKNPVAGRSQLALLDPPRFVIDLAGEWVSEATLPKDGSTPEIKSVRLGTHPDKLRVVLDFSRQLNLAPRFLPTATGLKVLLTESGAEAAKTQAQAQEGAAPEPRPGKPEMGKPDTGKPDAAAPGQERKGAEAEGPGVLQKIKLGQENGRATVEFVTQRPVEEFVYFEADAPPPRLVVNLPGRWRNAGPDQVEFKDGPLSLVAVEALPDRLRLTLTFRAKPLAKAQFQRTGSGLSVLLPESYEAPPPQAAKTEAAKTPAKPEKAPATPATPPSGADKSKPAPEPPKPAASKPAPEPAPAKTEAVPMREGANTVETLSLVSESGRTVVEVVTRATLNDFSYSRLDSPPRVVVTLTGAWAGGPKESEAQSGLVRKAGTAVYPDKLMLTLLLSGKLSAKPVVEDLGKGLRVTLEGAPGQPGSAEEEQAGNGEAMDRETLARKPQAKGKAAEAKVEPPVESKGEMKGEAKAGAEDQAQEAKAEEDKTRTLLGDKLKTQLFFSCTMSFASYQTLIWKEGEPAEAEVKTKLAPYKQVFRDIALRKGSDEEAWNVINSPVYDLGIELRRAGKPQSLCERLNRLNPEQMENLTAAAVKARNPEQVKSLVRQALTSPE